MISWHDFGKKGGYTGMDGSHNVVKFGPAFTPQNIFTFIKDAETRIKSSGDTGVVGISNVETVPGVSGSAVTRF